MITRSMQEEQLMHMQKVTYLGTVALLLKVVVTATCVIQEVLIKL